MIDFGAQMGRVRFHSDMTAESQTMRSMSIVSAGVALICATASPANAAISESQTLVVYNSASSEGTELKDAYLAAHPGIGPDNIVDLYDASLLTSDLTMDEFIAKIRNPIRDRMLILIGPGPHHFIAIVLIRPMPHRILDNNNPLVGDDPDAAFTEFGVNGDSTYASVDAELVLLWQDLFDGESGGRMDSYADNVIENPYHGFENSELEIDSFSRFGITTPKTFANQANFYWELTGSGSSRLTPGDMYLVCRIDGSTQSDALALIDRAQNLTVNRATTQILLDRNGGSSFEFIGDYNTANASLMADGWNVRYDISANFVDSIEEPRPLIAYASPGENHGHNGGENPPGSGTYIDGFTFARGAIFNSVETFNARGLNGLGTLYNHEQVEDFVSAGGTFAVGNVFENFEISQAENAYLLTHMLVNQRTWAEAAYSSIWFLSGQTIVLGDP
ncbi:MAG: hypothetical protein KDA54_22370, partial [Phycisphaerales bacterium]|nr:hypothetical protein [Phycisphaerales bacterium]